MSSIRKCDKCGTYTLKEVCSKCGSPTKSSKPPKFSPEDKYEKYRKIAKNYLKQF